MPIHINGDNYPEVIEIWGCSPNSIILNMTDGRQVKITALHNIKSGATPSYYADFEQRVEIEHNGETYRVWADVSYPWQVGETIESCLISAIGSVVHPY